MAHKLWEKVDTKLAAEQKLQVLQQENPDKQVRIIPAVKSLLTFQLDGYVIEEFYDKSRN